MLTTFARFHLQLCNQGLTRWDGARGKKQVLRSYIRIWGLSEANVG